jgi:hypothetical protein
MRRRRWIGAALVCAAAGAWLVLGRSSPEPAGEPADQTPGQPLAFPGDPGDEMLWGWNPRAKDTSLPARQILFKPKEVVSLMNSSADRSTFPHLLVLWQSGDPVPAGYTENRHPKDRTADDRELDEARAAPRWWQFEIPHGRGSWKTSPPHGLVPVKRLEFPRLNTLYEQTTLYLWLYGYRTRLIGDTVYVFREDALIPPLVTRTLYCCDPIAIPWYTERLGPAAVLPDGRVDFQAILDDSILFLPGTSAIMDPRAGTITLRLDRTGMKWALQSLDRRYAYDRREGTLMADSRFARWKWKTKQGAREAGEYLDKLRGRPSPPTP